MPKLTASLETASTFAPLAKAVYAGHVSAEEEQFSKKTGAPMVALQFIVDGGDYHGRELPGMGGWYYIMSGGKRENGEPHNLSRLFDTINALGAEWRCTDCGMTTTKRFTKEKVKGEFQYFYPNCGKRASVECNGSWVGLPCRIEVNVEKMENSENERNNVVRLFPRE